MARLLIWNRGEIAVRIAVAAERLGITSIASVTPADRDSRIAAWASELDWLDSSEAAETYLSLEAVTKAIARTRATHVHPGYGFLSESPLLCRAVEAAGAVFVGSSEAVLAEMASKSASKTFARDAGIPDLGLELVRDAEGTRIVGPCAYPVILKADAGGGGRGIAIVHAEAELKATALALSERAHTLFGDDKLLAERFLTRARHVELQVFGVSGRGVRVLDSRDCSVQRNYQKIIEEGPAPNRVLAAIGAYRAGIERALSRRGFRGAGTVEVLYDEATGGVFFLEMNPRIQVEHPVTEMRLGIDLIEWQLREAVRIEADALFDELDAPRCHVIEARVCAEDPAQAFMPDAGLIHWLDAPRPPWARWDSAQRPGAYIPAEYDPMIAKLVVVGADRAEALIHMRMALDHTHVHGVRTNLDLLRRIITAPAFVADMHETGWLEVHLGELVESGGVAGVGRADGAGMDASTLASLVSLPVTNDSRDEITTRLASDVVLVVRPGGARLVVSRDASGVVWADRIANAEATARVTISPAAPSDLAKPATDVGRVVAPTRGTLRSLCVAVGDSVALGQRLGVVEAMKMLLELRAPCAGVVASVAVTAGSPVVRGTEILVLVPA